MRNFCDCYFLFEIKKKIIFDPRAILFKMESSYDPIVDQGIQYVQKKRISLIRIKIETNPQIHKKTATYRFSFLL